MRCLHDGQCRPSGYKFTTTVKKLTQRPLCIHQNAKYWDINFEFIQFLANSTAFLRCVREKIAAENC